MTAQVTEALHYQGHDVSMRTEPLSDYLLQMKNPPRFQHQVTSCWRSYTGKWEITYDRLYLLHIHATYEDGTPVTLGGIFPGFEDRLFAHWYSGVLNVAQGKMLKYVHGGYASRYERDLLISVENGVVVNTEIRVNKAPGLEEEFDA